jgi:sialidase-1
MRSYAGQNRRAVARSMDGGLSWSKTKLDAALIEPVCQASLIRVALPGKKSDGRLIFANPADTKRDRMTVRISRDDGKTWSESKLIDAGPSAYSSLVALGRGEVGLLYEHGEKSPYERVTFLVLRPEPALEHSPSRP